MHCPMPCLQVQVWDAAGAASAPVSSTFEMGLLTPQDWQGAEWIQRNQTENKVPCDYYKPNPTPLMRCVCHAACT